MSIGTIQEGGSVVASSISRAPNISQHGQAITAGSKSASPQNQSIKDSGNSGANPNNGMPLEDAVSRLKHFVTASSDADIDFSIDQRSGVQVVKVVDRKTQETIRQIPSEEAINLAMALDKLQGLFVRDKV